MGLRNWNKAILADIAVIIVLSGLAYLPQIHELNYYRDDWYYMADGYSGGPAVFHEMFWIDRPARGYVFDLLFRAFGLSPLPYHITAFAWRLLSGLAALWLFRCIWPGHHRAALWGSLLFALFPGYLWWVSGIEYQPMILSALFETVSIALTVMAVKAAGRPASMVLWSASIATGWLYLHLVDYAIGMEVFRFLCVLLVIRRQYPSIVQPRILLRTFRAWLPASLVGLGFLGWRLLIFDNHREATDVGVQLGRLLEEPLRIGLWWLVRLVQSTANEVAFAWAVPLSRWLFGLGLTEIVTGLALALAALGVLAADRALRRSVIHAGGGKDRSPDAVSTLEARPGEVALVGLIGVVGGVAPIVIANRYYVFDAFSHYGLPASLSAALLMAAVLQSISAPYIRQALLAILVGCSTLTHYAVATVAANEEAIIRRFWWQVAWRAPSILPDTTLLVQYPAFYYGEDLDIVWGPANFLYGIQKVNLFPARYELSAVPVREDALREILVGLNVVPATYRTHTMVVDYGNVLVISQTAPNGCVHAMTGYPPRISSQESAEIALVADRSNGNNIQVDGDSREPPVLIFGPEPTHDWCYFYEKAELALQRGKMEEVASLGIQAERVNEIPVDTVEWMPFIQAYAFLGDEQRIEDLGTRLSSDAFQRQQACRILSEMPERGFELSQRMATIAFNQFCD